MDASPALREPASRRRRLLGSVAGTALLLGLALAWAGTEGIPEALGSLSPGVLLGAFVLQAGVSLVGGWRVHLVTRGEASYRLSLAIALVHAAFLLFAPLRMGELVYVWLVRRELGRVPARGLSQVLVFRLFDVLALAVLTLGLLALGGRVLIPNRAVPVTGLAAAAVGGMLLLTGALVLRGRAILSRVADRLARWERLAGGIRAAGEELGLGPRAAFLQLLASLAIWILVLVSATWVILDAGVELPAFQVGAILGIQRFLLVVPVPALGTFGPTEVTFTALALPLGVPRDQGLAAILVQHTLVLLYGLAMGAGGLLWLGRRRRAEAPAPREGGGPGEGGGVKEPRPPEPGDRSRPGR